MNLGQWGEIMSWLCLLPISGGIVYNLLTVFTTSLFLARSLPKQDFQPGVSVLKPVRGLEKNLEANLRTIAQQNYPAYEVIYCVQDPQDPALPIVKKLQAEFGPEKIIVAVHQIEQGANGKVNNLLGGLKHAKYDILVISDSDTNLRPDYLATMVSPLGDRLVGCVTTPFKLTQAQTWYEGLELLSINADFMPSVLFAEVTGASKACLGPSIAIRRSTLTEIGGLESLADYLVEDFELGQRVWTGGLKMVLLPYVIDAGVNLDNWTNWWSHQLYWDQNTYLARPLPFLATIIIRAVPFAFLFTFCHWSEPWAWLILFITLATRYGTAAIVAQELKDGETIRYLPLLLLRDCFGLVFWALSFSQRQVLWRGITYRLTKGGKMIPASPIPKS
ncbi:ceramide glucosyltransferase [Synechocystis sp. PCC 6803]|uniref:Ceramide glucosyltransferase n=2 Tax=Synechocystis TaxID=1142 RepID=P74046_SYNY3|nr:ceramide glucosyltransferase [Synechocystis sp. PCC 6803]AVP89621.1 ceramide glucosyltransferase [Synechocystis sp. IPPAS B-1465]MBD2618757.1 bacteriohopanetetrol glucosamine biosynthesis glycosyltransferase HpnI [Synechocystis sp. FACHB-898]MBD2640260.1 bacteriohopanetetrol glucosamine biosynthesis glycosyltransferase HpnI [Synechocystis sp. FACHB-908]MBD2661382.1 bacteriohopanetetrol glucosamine biosynthesis glycosyltransferase HpnI [Synechocystis sp. FACHB-929]BAL29293.1 glycosyltransfer